MTIMPIGAALAAAHVAPVTGVTPAGVTHEAQAAAGTGFASLLSGGIEHLTTLQKTSDNLAVQAATGDLKDVHDYTIAAASASTALELTVAVRNKAVEAFNDIMRMQI